MDVENRFDFQAVKPSCPLRKALIMLFRGELSEMRQVALSVTEDKVHLALFENHP